MRIRRAHVGWSTLIGSAVCFVLGATLLYWAEMPLLHKRVCFVLLAIPFSLVTLIEVGKVFQGKKCALCGFYSYDGLSDFDPCPHCGGLFGDVANLMPKEEGLRLREYLADGRPCAKLIGMVLTLAIRDGVEQIRLVGRNEEDESESPLENLHRKWRIWFDLEGKSYEIVPPPRFLGTQVYCLFRETHRRVNGDAASDPACLSISLDDYMENVELSLTTSEEEDEARIVFTNAHEPWEGAGQILNDVFERTRNMPCADVDASTREPGGMACEES